jgi:integrase
MLQLACHVPPRPGELFGVEWSALDLDEATFDVRANLVRHDGEYLLHDTKTHERRTVPLAGAVADALRRHRVAQAEERRPTSISSTGRLARECCRPVLLPCISGEQRN